MKDNLLSLALTGTFSLAPLVTVVVENGGQIEEVRKGRKSLEEVFLTLVTEKKQGE